MDGKLSSHDLDRKDNVERCCFCTSRLTKSAVLSPARRCPQSWAKGFAVPNDDIRGHGTRPTLYGEDTIHPQGWSSEASKIPWNVPKGPSSYFLPRKYVESPEIPGVWLVQCRFPTILFREAFPVLRAEAWPPIWTLTRLLF